MSQRNLVVSLSPVLVIGRRSVAGSAWRPGRWIAGREGVEARAVDLVEGFGRAAMANEVCCAGMGLRERFGDQRSEEHTSELQSLMRISYAVFCLKKHKVTSMKQCLL